MVGYNTIIKGRAYNFEKSISFPLSVIFLVFLTKQLKGREVSTLAPTLLTSQDGESQTPNQLPDSCSFMHTILALNKKESLLFFSNVGPP
jgi:hypothetical protein